MAFDTSLLPDPRHMTTVVAAPGPGPGHWAGAPSAWRDGADWWLAYRIRRPLDEGRGVATVVSHSLDGVSFAEVARVEREGFGAESFERPALVRLRDGRWRLYLSCATPGSKHWWVECLTAASPAGLPQGERYVVAPGDRSVGVKDPVVLRDGDGWRMWLCAHPLDESGAEDRMTTRHLVSDDGLRWTDDGLALAGTVGSWDARGTRVTAVLALDPLTVLYDGRATAAGNWFETTGLAQAEGPTGRLRPDPAVRLRSPHSEGAFRYACAVPTADGRVRWFAEQARADGAHDLVTTLI